MAGLDELLSELLDEKQRPEAKGRSTLIQRKSMHEAWNALNSWMLEKLSQHKGVSIPNFATVTWHFDAADGANGEVKCRPVFALTESFCRGNKMPYKKAAAGAENAAPCAELNHSLLALRYTRVLTKDMVFTALRDIVRKLGEKIGRSDKRIALRFSVGTLHAHERKIAFEFDMAALRHGMEMLQQHPPQGTTSGANEAAMPPPEAAPTDRSTVSGGGGGGPASQSSFGGGYAEESSAYGGYDTQKAASSSASSAMAGGGGGRATAASDPGGARVYDDVPAADYGDDGYGGGGDGEDGYGGYGYEAEPPADDFALSRFEPTADYATAGLVAGGGGGASDAGVLEKAYARHIAELEHEAERGYLEQVRNDDMLHHGDVEEREKRKNKLNASLELQSCIRDQMSSKSQERNDEQRFRSSGGVHAVLAERRKKETLRAAGLLDEDDGAADGGAGVPVLDREGGVADTLGASVPKAVFVPAARKAITGAPLKGKAKAISSGQLLADLQTQMSDKEGRKQAERAAMLEEVSDMFCFHTPAQCTAP